jgi:hypothetical protein
MVDTPARGLTIVSPIAEYRDVEQASSKHAERRGLTGRRALLLPAEKSSSPPFIRALVERMSADTHVSSAFMRSAEWAFFHPRGAPLIDAEVDALARECDVMISGVAY